MTGNATLKTNIEALKKRAMQRNISFSSKAKTESDVKVENDFFKTMEGQIYKQIVRN
jgi:hypothetical protein